jgi:hypothetical protein
MKSVSKYFPKIMSSSAERRKTVPYLDASVRFGEPGREIY